MRGVVYLNDTSGNIHIRQDRGSARLLEHLRNVKNKKTSRVETLKPTKCTKHILI